MKRARNQESRIKNLSHTTMNTIFTREELEHAATKNAWLALGFLVVAAHGLVVVYWTIMAMGFLWALVPLAALVFLILGGLCSLERWCDVKAELWHQDRRGPCIFEAIAGRREDVRQECLTHGEEEDFEEEVDARVRELEEERRRISPAARGGCESPSGGGGAMAGAAGQF